MDERYKRFTPHEDNVEEIISADHLNELQDQSHKNQKELFRQDDTDFLDRALFVLEHHPVINSLYIDLLKDPTMVDEYASVGLNFSEDEAAFVFEDNTKLEATLFGKEYVNPNSTSIKRVILMSSQTTPLGSSLTFELSNNGQHFFEVIPNESNVFEFPTTGGKLHVRVKFKRSADVKSPMLKGYAVLFRDATYLVDFAGLDESKGPCTNCGNNPFSGYSHNDLTDVGPDDHHPQMHAHDGTDGSGLISHTVLTDIGEDDHHNKDHRHGQDGVEKVHLETDVIGTLGMEHLSYILQTGNPGNLQLTRNPNAHDRLVIVKSPDNDTYLFYDWANAGRLNKIITIVGDIATEETLNYGPYIDEKGSVSTVMLGTTKQIKDATDAAIVAMIATVMAPAP